LVRLQARVDLLPPVERLLRDPDLARHVGHAHPELGLLQHRHDLLDRESLPFHDKPPAAPAAQFAENSPFTRTGNRAAYQLLVEIPAASVAGPVATTCTRG